MKMYVVKIIRLNILVMLLLSLLASCSREPTNTPTPVSPTSTAVILPTDTDTPEPTTTTIPSPSPQPTREPMPDGLVQLPVPDSVNETVAALMEAEFPVADRYRLAAELLRMDPNLFVPEVPSETNWQVGDRADFYVRLAPGGHEYKTHPARLRFLSENAAWWTSVKATADDDEIAAAAERFEENVLQINRLAFGKEWSPGIDDDPRIHILMVNEPIWGGVNGYFSTVNEYPTSVQPFSNQKEMFYINLANVRLDSLAFDGYVAHEYQHLIHWYKDPNEDLWLNEALSGLAYFFSGAPTTSSKNARVFSQQPDIQLTKRPERRYGDEDLSVFAHYAAEELFLVYLLEQFGPRFIVDVVDNTAAGVVSIQQELDKLPEALRFEDVYANWLVANLLNQPNLMEGQYGYREIKPILPEREVIQAFSGSVIADQLPPYGARYYEIRSDEDVKVSFSGSTLARLTPADPVTGEYTWYSNRGNESAFSLSRTFDLTDLDSATLNYNIWYELEEYYDYGYVEISVDGGKTWTVLETTHGTDQDPYDLAYGFGYTGTTLEWLSESIDLSAYAGQEVQLRFEVITDFSNNRDGLQIDDIEIPELGYYDGAEDDNGGWEAQGFVRSTNIVPVEWIVWLIQLSRPTEVEQVEVDTSQSAEFEIVGFGEDFPFAAMVISPTAPVTTMELDYELIFEHR